jgi:sarcosine oxidase
MSGDLDAEVGVIGLGAIGSMALFHLARRGVDAIGLEQYWAPHDRGASAGESRLFRTLPYLESHPEDVEILAATAGGWDVLERESGHELRIPCGGLLIGWRDSAPMQRLVELAGQRADADVLDPEQVRSRYPAHRLADDEIAVLDRAGGLVRAELSVAAALRAAVARGARLETRTRVLRWELEDDAVAVVTAARRYRFRKVVLATGPWARELLPELAMRPRRLLLTWFTPRSPDLLPQFSAPAFPSFLRADERHFLYGGPTLDGVMVKVAGGDDWGYPTDPRALDRDVDVDDLAGISEEVSHCLEGLSPAPARVDVYMDGWSDDGTPLVDLWPGTDSVVVCAGFTGFGFKISPIIGEIAADLATEGGTRFPIGHMRAGRPVGAPPTSAAVPVARPRTSRGDSP